MPRQGRPPARGNTGAISENRVAWLQTYIGQFILMAYPEGHNADSDDVPSIKAEPGPTVRLLFPKNGRTLSYTLTALTHDEFKAMRQLFNLAFDIAEPIVEQRDKAAQLAYESGDDSFVRIYRQVPQLVVREGALRENGVGLPERSDDHAGRAGRGEPESGGLRGVGAELAEREPEASLAQDDEPTPH